MGKRMWMWVLARGFMVAVVCEEVEVVVVVGVGREGEGGRGLGEGVYIGGGCWGSM